MPGARAAAAEVAAGAVAGEGPGAGQRPPVRLHPGDCFPAQHARVLVTPKGTRWPSPRVPSLWALVFLSGVAWLSLPRGRTVVPRASLTHRLGPRPWAPVVWWPTPPTPPCPAVQECALTLQPPCLCGRPGSSTTLLSLCPRGPERAWAPWAAGLTLPWALLCPFSAQGARPCIGFQACGDDVENQHKGNERQGVERRAVGGVSLESQPAPTGLPGSLALG